MSVLTAIPADVQASIVSAILNAAHPRIALPDIAHNHKLTLEELQTLARHHGYPDRSALVRSLRKLEQAAAAYATVRDDDQANDEADGGDVTASGQKLLRVPLNQLHPDPNNVRENLGDLEDLAESIVAVGLLQPIVARRHGEQLIIVAGHRRYAAIARLGWASVPVIVRADMAPDEVLAAMIIENSQRADLDPIEEARGLARLKAEYGLTTDVALARKIGRHQTHVSARLTLLALSPEDQEAVRSGRLGVTAATQKARTDSGRRRPGAKGRAPAQHLSISHDLAKRANNRCVELSHKRKGAGSVGGVACGECWESVIRADERERTHAASAAAGRCLTCGTEHDPDRATA
jgi:ParB family chromosome partitioning protein